MTNPYDVYNDNRAYMGYLRAIKDIREQLGITIEVDNDRFGYLLNEERDSVFEGEN